MKTETTRRQPCDYSVVERPRYYARQLITPDDMTLEQEYFRDKLRRHNRLLHGWGVVCGALVCTVPRAGAGAQAESEPWLVRVQPGYVLGPYGDEIILDCTRTVDLRTGGVTGVTGEPCVDAPDPWCAEVFEPRDTGDLYVAVKYKEIKTRPVRVQPVGCGCDDTACEYSRWRDGYEICVLPDCPDTHVNPPDREAVIPSENKLPPCPPCPDEPWVVLARVTVGAEGRIEGIDNCACRRMVVSFGHFWWGCRDEPEAPSPEPRPAEPEQPRPAGRPIDSIRIDRVETRGRELGPGEHTVMVLGQNLDAVASVGFGPGVEVVNLQPEPARLGAQIKISPDAAPGTRAMEFHDRQGNRGEFRDALIIRREEAPAPAPPPPPAPAPSERQKKAPSKRGQRDKGEEV